MNVIATFRHFLKLGVPDSVAFALLAVMLIGFVYLTIRKKPMQWYYVLLLVAYILLLLFKTVIFRPISVEDTDPYPFWSYVDGFNGKTYLLVQIVLNIIMFMPIGMFVAGCVKTNGVLKASLIGFGLSVTIEILQWSLSKGLAEFDDVFHNTLGCLLGYYTVRGFQSITKRAKRHKMSLENLDVLYSHKVDQRTESTDVR